jgi:hypothetical protein
MNINVPDTFAIGLKGDGGSGFPFQPPPLLPSRKGIGVLGTTSDPNGTGVWGVNTAGGNAAAFNGNVAVGGNVQVTGAMNIEGNVAVTGTLTHTGNATVTGTLTVGVDIFLPAADCAEEFEIGSVAEAEPGTVMVLDDAGLLQLSFQPYDKKVAGVISGAGLYRPGIILDRGKPSPTRLPLALVGKVFCKVDAQYGPIEVGDMLTTSPTRGHAMNARDRSLAFGAVIGKALKRLSKGCGLVPILVALQ